MDILFFKMCTMEMHVYKQYSKHNSIVVLNPLMFRELMKSKHGWNCIMKNYVLKTAIEITTPHHNFLCEAILLGTKLETSSLKFSLISLASTFNVK